jgi:hypothetical protein
MLLVLSGGIFIAFTVLAFLVTTDYSQLLQLFYELSSRIPQNMQEISADTFGFEVFTAETMKNTVFWNVTTCSHALNRRYGGKFSTLRVSLTCSLGGCLLIFGLLVDPEH